MNEGRTMSALMLGSRPNILTGIAATTRADGSATNNLEGDTAMSGLSDALLERARVEGTSSWISYSTVHAMMVGCVALGLDVEDIALRTPRGFLSDSLGLAMLLRRQEIRSRRIAEARNRSHWRCRHCGSGLRDAIEAHQHYQRHRSCVVDAPPGPAAHLQLSGGTR